jgi:hypothetical protein
MKEAKKPAERTRTSIFVGLMKVERALAQDAMTHGAAKMLTAVGSANGTRPPGKVMWDRTHLCKTRHGRR